MDSHKLLFHPQRVARWLEGEDIFPLYMEISPSGACNHRCRFCAQDYLGYRPAFLDGERVAGLLAELGQLGLRSVMYAGEGEPLLHRGLAEIVEATTAAGIDAALTTNGVLLSPALSERLVGGLSWLRVSLNAGTAETYAAVHGTRPEDFERVLENLARAVQERDRQGSACTLGAQLILLPENAGEVEGLALRLRDLGADYLAVKPYAHHPLSSTQAYADYIPSAAAALGERLASLADGRFQVIFRATAMGKAGAPRGYERCLALPFWAYLDATGGLWACKMFAGAGEFFLGNVWEAPVAEIWRGERRREAMVRLRERDVCECVAGCRMDEVNRYLWTLQHPPPHVNFI
ncbi:MAG: radical SAM protein [Deferrisomatales bacterium]|nr:radical SAM protein [Deferrisomatales bacterium]